ANSSCMQMTPNSSSPSVNTTPPSITRNSATAIAGSATITRAPRSERSRAAARRPCLPERAAAVRGRVRARIAITASLSPAEAPASSRILRQGLLERLAREVGPQLLAKHELGVGRLPQQVVG